MHDASCPCDIMPRGLLLVLAVNAGQDIEALNYEARLLFDCFYWNGKH
jgi:hypothetical protein